MLKSRQGSTGDSVAAGPSTTGDMTAAVVADRPRKKLSFREPEIMGYYMQMKQGVTNRLSRKYKNKTVKGTAGTASATATATGEESDKLIVAVDGDEDLEVNLLIIVNVCNGIDRHNQY